MLSNISVLVIAVLFVVCSAEWKACQKDGFHVATARDGKPILCGRSSDRPKKCPGSDKRAGYCDTDPTDATTAFCCISSLGCSEKKCPKGTVCVEEKKEGGVEFAKCTKIPPSSAPTSATTPASSSSPSTSRCNGVIDKGLCYDLVCLPARRQSRLQITLSIKCENKAGYACVRTGKSVRCVDKGMTATTDVVSLPTSTTATGSTTSETSTPTSTTATGSTTSETSTSATAMGSTTSKSTVSTGSDAPTSVTSLCDDRDNKTSKDGGLKCSKGFANRTGKCIHNRCIARRNRINKCEKKGKYCMKDDLGRIDCKACTGIEQNGTCIVKECIKPNATSAVSECTQLGGLCSKVGRVIICVQDDKTPEDTSNKSTCMPKVNDKRRGRNKTDDDDDDDDDDGKDNKHDDVDNDDDDDDDDKDKNRNKKKDKDDNDDDYDDDDDDDNDDDDDDDDDDDKDKKKDKDDDDDNDDDDDKKKRGKKD